MQYKIFCDDYILYDSQLNDFQLESPVEPVKKSL